MILPSLSIIRQVRSLGSTRLERSRLHRASSDWTSKLVLVLHDSKVGQRQLQRIPGLQTRGAEILCLHAIRTHVESEVAPVVVLIPLQLAIIGGEPAGDGVGFVQMRGGAVRAWGRDGCAGKFDADAACAAGLVIVYFVEPD